MWLQNQFNVTAEMKSIPGISVLVQRGRGLLGNACLENSLVWWAQTTCPWLKQSHWAYEDKGFEEQFVEVRRLLLLNWCHSLFWTSWQVMLWAVEWPCVSRALWFDLLMPNKVQSLNEPSFLQLNYSDHILVQIWCGQTGGGTRTAVFHLQEC